MPNLSIIIVQITFRLVGLKMLSVGLHLALSHHNRPECCEITVSDKLKLVNICYRFVMLRSN